MRFETGDRVRVVKAENDIMDIEPEKFIGACGIIDDYHEDLEYPYEITFDNEELNDSDNALWKKDELELE